MDKATPTTKEMNAKEHYEQWITERKRKVEFQVVWSNTEDETGCELTQAIIFDVVQKGYFLYHYNSETDEGEEIWIDESMINFFKGIKL